MATVIGIFENCFKTNKPITIVKPGTQSRRFTHIFDTVNICYTILEVAKMFGSKIKFLNQRPGERYASALTNLNLKNKVFKHFGKIKLKDYIRNITK